MDARVQDYLDDKLQSVTDLDSLDSLLAAVQEQQHLLKQQVISSLPMIDYQADRRLARRCQEGTQRRERGLPGAPGIAKEPGNRISKSTK